jgi:hypothetical protein
MFYLLLFILACMLLCLECLQPICPPPLTHYIRREAWLAKPSAMKRPMSSTALNGRQRLKPGGLPSLVLPLSPHLKLPNAPPTSPHQITQGGTSDSPPIPSLRVFSISAPPYRHDHTMEAPVQGQIRLPAMLSSLCLHLYIPSSALLAGRFILSVCRLFYYPMDLPSRALIVS